MEARPIDFLSLDRGRPIPITDFLERLEHYCAINSSMKKPNKASFYITFIVKEAHYTNVYKA